MSLQEYKCPSCGGAIRFDSSIQKMKCPYCGTELEMESLLALDEELNNDLGDSIKWDKPEEKYWEDKEIDNMVVYGCKSCGGEIAGDSNMAATSCPYCGNPVVIMGKFKGELKPDYVLPFKLDKETAKKALYSHMKGKRLIPKIFMDENRIEEIKGIYVPFWLFTADVDTRIRCKATKVRFWSDKNYDYTMTSFYSVVRRGNMSFTNIPVDGSSKLDDDLMESIEPYDFKDTVNFQTSYLAGYYADKYDMTSGETIDRANERIKKSAESSILSTIKGYDTVVPESKSVKIDNGETKYALLPVWLLSTTWNGEKYTFAMNGQTGKFVGDLPLDKKEYWKWFSLITAISSSVVYILAKIIIGG